MLEPLILPSVIILAITSILLIVVSDWRVRLLLLASQYLGEFFLVSQSWPIAMAISTLVAGWMAGAILGMALVGKPIINTSAGNRAANNNLTSIFSRFINLRLSNIFFLLAAILVGLFVLSISPTIKTWFPSLSIEQIWAGMILLGMGLLQLGFRHDPFSITLGLLTMLSGFQILYAAIENSTLVAGLIAAINLGLALVGSYLILAPQMEEEE